MSDKAEREDEVVGGVDIRFAVKPRSKDPVSYRLTADTHSWRLERVVVGQSGAAEGVERFMNPRYLTTLGSVAKNLLDEGLRMSEAQSIADLQEAHEQIVAQIEKIFALPKLRAAGIAAPR